MDERGRRAEIVLGGGCFWCVEAAFEMVEGVTRTTPGYSGGTTSHPSYDEVCGGLTGHAEAVKVEYDPSVVTLEQLLEVFFTVHDPTTLNRQGADVGTQYRSIILYTSEEQRAQVDSYLEEMRPRYSGPVVTEVRELETFWPAEEHHHDYYAKNPRQPYCRVVIAPKLEKLAGMGGKPYT
jgi:peptide-methionine (S)-S-oxide reductase